MSFIKKAVKKVFGFVKRVIKSDAFKWIVIAALVFFTAGVAAGGFAAFTGVTGVGSFFTAVGQTIATGAASVASGFGFQGVSSSLASHGGAAAIQAGLTTTATSATGAALTANAASGTISAAGGSNAGAIVGGNLAQRGGEALALSSKAVAAAQATSNAALVQEALKAQAAGETLTGTQTEALFATLTANPPSYLGKSVMISGLTTGVTALLKTKMEQADKRPTFVAGDLSFGGGDRVDVPSFTFGPPLDEEVQGPITGETYQPQYDLPEQSVAGSLARQESPYQATLDPQGQDPAGNYSGVLAGAYDEEQSPTVAEAQGIFAQASQPKFQNNNSFFAARPEPIKQKPSSGSLEDRLFGGYISGVA